MKYEYTDRKIAIFSDIHGLLEPLEAVVADIQRRCITEIYSLGDNIGVGPCPCEVIDMLECYNIKSVAGNSEEYCTLGIEPFILYFNKDKILYQMWTKSKLDDYRLSYIENLYHSYDLEIGGKKVDCYNSIIQGHVHRNLYEKENDMEFYTIRAVALHFDNDPIDKAFYIILHEKTNNMGFDVEKVYVSFDRDRMEDTILRSDEPTGIIKKMVRMI